MPAQDTRDVVPQGGGSEGVVEGHWARWRSEARERTWAWDPPVNRFVRIWVPLLGLFGGLGFAVVWSGDPAMAGLFLLWYHSPFGMYTGIPAGVALGLSWQVVLWMVTVLHVFIGLFIVWNTHALKALPWLGPRIARVEEKGRQKWEERPRLRDMGVAGIGIFTAAAVPGTGLVTGALVGRVVGLPWFPTFLAVTAGGMGRVIVVSLVVFGVWTFVPWP